MDAKDYDRIADLLMQIRTKYAHIETRDSNVQDRLTWMIKSIDLILNENNIVAIYDDKGWI